MKKIIITITILILLVFGVSALTKDEFKSLNIDCDDWQQIKNMTNVINLTMNNGGYSHDTQTIYFTGYYQTLTFDNGEYNPIIKEARFNEPVENWINCRENYSFSICKNALDNIIKNKFKDKLKNEICMNVYSKQQQLIHNNTLDELTGSINMS